MESKGKPSDEEFCPELNQQIQLNLKPEKKQSNPYNNDDEETQPYDEEFRPELNQNQQIQLKPKKRFRPELNQD